MRAMGQSGDRVTASGGCARTGFPGVGARTFGLPALLLMLGCTSSTPSASPGDAEAIQHDAPEVSEVHDAAQSGRDAQDAHVSTVSTANSGDLSDLFFVKMRDNCLRIGCNPLELLSVWANESGVRAKAWNQGGNASGLCQLMPGNMASVGWTRTTADGKPDHAAFRALPADEQVDYAFKFYSWYKGSLVTATNDYVATFLPADLSLPEDTTTVLCSHYAPPRACKFPWAYDANMGFDTGKKRDIQRGDLNHAITRACVGARWNEIVARMKAVM